MIGKVYLRRCALKIPCSFFSLDSFHPFPLSFLSFIFKDRQWPEETMYWKKSDWEFFIIHSNARLFMDARPQPQLLLLRISLWWHFLMFWRHYIVICIARGSLFRHAMWWWCTMALLDNITNHTVITKTRSTVMNDTSSMKVYC